MKIIDLLNEDKVTLSFEVFPPKTSSKYENVLKAAEKIASLNPSFMSVTYGAGGGTSAHTVALAKDIHEKYGVEVMAHLTCVSSTREHVESMVEQFKENGIETEILQVGNVAVRGCMACGACTNLGKCVFDDIVNEIAPKFEKADGIVVSSPVYYASANATLIAVLDRLFYSTCFDKTMKVGASVVSCRRGGASATFDELTISGMPVVSSQYWNSIHGNNALEANQDEEGKQTMRTLARNMIFLMKSIALGKEVYGLPEKEVRKGTNFIR